jgi:thiol:disulfide interchange protein DsbD
LGVFEFTGRFSSLGSSLAAKEGIVGSFFSGVLATLVATPCTAPFMGTAMGFALSQSPGVALLIFSSLGLGLAFPYVFLSLFPSLQRKLPRPGHWMERFKHAMAFPLFLTAAWLLWVLGLQVGVDALFEILLFLICLAFTFWAFGLSRTIRARFFWIFLASVLSAASLYRIQPLSAEPMSDQAQGAWMPFDDAAFEKALDSGKPVFVDFTAAWCITCKVNEKVALNISSVQKKFKEKEVQLFQADWTNQNSEIARRLENYGISGVPLYVLYPEGRKSAYVLLPQILTPEIVLKALEKLP